MNQDFCVRCGECMRTCKFDAIQGETAETDPLHYVYFEIRQRQCVRCGECMNICPTGAIELISKVQEEFIEQS
ncbi:MAG: 4Fe-4S binding protein [Nitrospirota bacterium]